MVLLVTIECRNKWFKVSNSSKQKGDANI